jgi:hypothetical protein
VKPDFPGPYGNALKNRLSYQRVHFFGGRSILPGSDDFEFSFCIGYLQVFTGDLVADFTAQRQAGPTVETGVTIPDRSYSGADTLWTRPIYGFDIIPSGNARRTIFSLSGLFLQMSVQWVF